jgi:hypothetical protein
MISELDERLLRLRDDLAPKFYPDLSSFGRLDVPIRAVVAAGAGAELSA